jgi:hypothetical protein
MSQLLRRQASISLPFTLVFVSLTRSMATRVPSMIRWGGPSVRARSSAALSSGACSASTFQVSVGGRARQAEATAKLGNVATVANQASP